MSLGLSTIHLAAAVRDNGGGHLHSFDRVDAVLRNVPAELADRWTFVQGDVAACASAVAAGVKAVEKMGASVYSSVVIPTPHPDLVKITRRYAFENLLP